VACLAQASKAAATWQSAVANAARVAPQARIVVLSVADGRLLASRHPAEAARTLAYPGSSLKPIGLYGLIAAGRWDPSRRVACSRKLSVAGHSLNCSHPPGDPMDARQALAWSCNSYFAAVADALAPGELRRLLAPSGLLAQTGLASGEAIADFREPQTPDQARLALLGVEGVRVTPFELAAAYRWLALQFAAHPGSSATEAVLAGLEDSASFGVAGAAGLGGVTVAGKTGTASAEAGAQSHGWFAGLAPSDAPRVAIVIYLPSGRGADAARVAAELLAHSPLRQP
jgi:cell division protein FtsI/penicillin-binding protein 2